MTPSVQFRVFGVPAQQGSKVASVQAGKAVMREASKRTKPWRAAVAEAAAEVARTVPQFDGPLRLTVVLRFPMPASARKADRERGYRWKSTTPDADKLARAVGDSLTASGLIRDDARFAEILARKVEVTGWTGAAIEVAPAWPVDSCDVGDWFGDTTSEVA
jgi:crossover junction endodeoxyribonuclease RusA